MQVRVEGGVDLLPLPGRYCVARAMSEAYTRVCGAEISASRET